MVAPVAGPRFDDQPGASGARGLLMTVLGEFVLPHGGGAWTQTIIAAMDQLGVRDKATRQALTRTEDRGWLRRDRVGRKTRWVLTSDGRDLLAVGAERIYGFGAEARDWRGSWVVLLASVPERDRATRYRMRQGLNWAGFGSVGPGLWISPWAAQEQVAVESLAGLDVEATSFIAEIGQLGSGESLASQAWDLPSLHGMYQTFLDDTASLGADSVLPVADLTDLVHQWRRFPFLDPELPADVLPADWLGPEASQRFAEVRACLQPIAADWWQQSEANHTR